MDLECKTAEILQILMLSVSRTNNNNMQNEPR